MKDEAATPEYAEYGYLALLRHLERRNPDLPRIGRARRVRDEIVRLGQDPFLAFPDCDLSEVDLMKRPPIVRSRFLGFFGAFGALPLNTTEEVFRWFDSGDKSFVDFADIFVTRFIQLFYRSWADSRAITQFDHARDDRFRLYLMGMTGIGTPTFHGRDSINDTVKLRLVPLAMGRVKSAVRLRQMLELHFETDVEVQEMVPTWMEFEPDSLSRLGVQGSSLGRDMHLGSRVQSIGEKICIHVRVPTLAAYRRFLPGGTGNAHLRDIVFWYLGRVFEVDVAVWLPRREVPAARLGATAELGWMACIAPSVPAGSENEYLRGTIYRLDPTAQDSAVERAA